MAQAKRIEVPGLGVVEFPATMSDQDIERVLQAQSQPQRSHGPQSLADLLTTDPMTGFPISRSRGEAEEFRGSIGEAGSAIAPHAIGAGLPAAGAAIGAVSPIPGGALIGETAGSLAARKINVALGFEEPGIRGDVAAGAFPGVIRGVGAAAKGLLKRLPGVGTGMQEAGVTEARGMVSGLKPWPQSDGLYSAVAKQNPPINLPNVASEVSEVLAKEAAIPSQLQSSTIKSTAEGLREIAGQGTDFQTLWQIQKRIRDQMSRAHGEEFHSLGRLDAAIWKDMEALAGEGNQVAELLRQANRTYRKERAVEDLGKIVEGSITEAVQGQGTGKLNAGAMLKSFDRKVREDSLFAGAFPKEEQAEIRSLLKDLAMIPVPGPVAGAMFGAGLPAGAFGLTYSQTEDPKMAGLAAAAPWLLSIGLATAPGRALVRSLMHSGKLFTPEGMAALRGTARTAGQIEVEGGNTGLSGAIKARQQFKRN